MRHLRLLVPGIMMVFLAGCYQVKTVVKVNPDGSGTVEESMLLSKKFLAQLDEMMQGLAGEGGTKPEPTELFEPEKLKAQAGNMGKGVTYRSGKKMETADYKGYAAVYAFTDINKLRLNQQSGGSPGAGKSENVPIIFHFKKGSPATLTIEQRNEKKEEKPAATVGAEPVPENSAEPASAPAEAGAVSDEEAKKMAELFLGMKFSMEVEINGTIVTTNATHRDGKRLTIMEFDLGKLSASAPELQKLSKLQNASFAEAKEMVKEIPGMKVDMNDKLTVVFKK